MPKRPVDSHLSTVGSSSIVGRTVLPTDAETVMAEERPESVDSTPSKRQRFNTDVSTLFIPPNCKADVKVDIFGHDFLISSDTLVSKSAFFRKVLDPVNGALPLKNLSPYKYIFSAKADPDDLQAWSLSCNSVDNDEENIDAFEGDPITERNAFHNMLCAIFAQQYELEDGLALVHLTKLAELFGCLPTVSHSLWGPFYTSPGLVPSIPKYSCDLIQAAVKLHHEPLFKECFVHILGPASSPRYLKLTDQTLKGMARLAHNRLSVRLLNVHQQVFEVQTDAKKYGSVTREMIGIVGSSKNRQGHFLMPSYLRGWYEMDCQPACQEFLKQLLEPLLLSKLFLDKTDAKAGEARFKDCFLFFEPSSIPWDKDEKEWW